MWREIVIGISGLVALGAYVPYGIDIMHGKVRPARAARMMLALLLVVACLQQRSLGSGLTLLVTLGEAVGSLAILGLSMKHGVGGVHRVELWCYGLLAADVLVWLMTNHALFALHLSVLADLIAFAPTLWKTWHQPHTETPLFYAAGAIAPCLAVLAGATYSYSVMLFPLYLAGVNFVQIGLIYRRRWGWA